MAWPLVLAALGTAAVVVARTGKVITGPIPEVIPLPPGWRRLKKGEKLSDDVIRFAQERLKATGKPGTFVERSIDDRDYGSLTEWHFHEPGGPVKPWGWHYGITILTKA